MDQGSMAGQGGQREVPASQVGKVTDVTYPRNGSPIAWGAQNKEQAQDAILKNRMGMFAQRAGPALSMFSQQRPQEQTFQPNYSPAVFGKMDQVNMQGRSGVPFTPIQSRDQLTPDQMGVLSAYRPDLSQEPELYRGNGSDYRSMVNRQNQVTSINDFFKNYRG